MSVEGDGAHSAPATPHPSHAAMRRLATTAVGSAWRQGNPSVPLRKRPSRDVATINLASRVATHASLDMSTQASLAPRARSNDQPLLMAQVAAVASRPVAGPHAAVAR